jgi:hypothetical protein
MIDPKECRDNMFAQENMNEWQLDIVLESRMKASIKSFLSTILVNATKNDENAAKRAARAARPCCHGNGT